MKYYVDKNISETKRIFPEQGRYDYYRFDMNENPEGLPKAFVDEVVKEITPEFLSIYPEPDKFIYKYAKFIGSEYENILPTNGSDMAIRYLLETFGIRGSKVVTVSPSFEMYWVNCSLLGLNHIPVPYEKDWTININNIIDAIDDDTSIVVLLNPNNPIGNVYTDDEVKKVISKAEQCNAIVIIDEAYHYFYPNTFINYALDKSNVIILRTFSKLLSLAACRLGVIISNPKIIHYVKNSKLTFDVNSIALLFGEKILDNTDLIDSLIKTEAEGKAYTIQVLKNNGYECKDCKGNFILIKANDNAENIARRLKNEKKVLVHSYKNPMLQDYIRVSTGSKKVMKVFLDAFLELDN